ncbi:MAG: metal ABC transporter permease [Gammaproteobacteria bacterium]|nr:metal ABC transporter permease [Gammaproteobacteria bacterium]
MMMDGLELSILGPAFIAGLLVLITHVPLGQKVLARGIIFIDLAIAQIAGLGVIAAYSMGWEEQTYMVQLSAALFAIAGALFLSWTEKFWDNYQEAIIGVVFVLSACISILLLVDNPHGGEHLKELLVGQVLWVNVHQLIYAATVTGCIVAFWLFLKNKLSGIWFYILFSIAVTTSVQLVGVYLVFSSLIMPALFVSIAGREKKLTDAYVIGIVGYALGLLLSAWLDLPSGPMIVVLLAFSGVLYVAVNRYVSGLKQV